MPDRLDLPVLSQKDYAALVKELTASIPRYSDNWTDYNFSDPGTTLLQLLAWLGDITLYRIDTVPNVLYLNFAYWLVGAAAEALETLVEDLESEVLKNAQGNTLYLGDDPTPLDPPRLKLAQYLLAIQNGAPLDLTTLRQNAIAFWATPYRAVSEDDFILLTRQVTADPTTYQRYVIERVVARARQPAMEVLPITMYPIGYSVSVQPAKGDGPALQVLSATIQSGTLLNVSFDYQTLCPAVAQYLNPRRLLGTPVTVAPPTYNPVTLDIHLAVLPQADPAAVLNAVFNAVVAFVSPTTGGADGTGWPYGRGLTNDDVLSVVAQVPGIDHSQPIHVNAQTLFGYTVGESTVGVTSLLGPGYELGLPRIWTATITASSDTWTLQVGVHARLGIDTLLPYPGI
ncbi:MAG: hypothetical protein EON95_17215 [Caulobacteraceae bacterium]|nr:MAG: hypothetical protein EON95_17215 [Caulobacteraceae bacterium]